MEDLRINENSHDDRSEAMDIDEVSPSLVEKDTQLPGQQKTKKTPIKPIKITYKHINEIYKLLTKP
ncbi:MAG: hypothetical protein ACIPMY_01185 [Rickettsia endosymbiont of Pentastiridius leporinus]